MPPKTESLTSRFLHRRTLGRWQRLADGVADLAPAALRLLSGRARQLRRQLDRVIREADHRLALPATGSNAMRAPVGSDWAWRPEPWCAAISVPGIASVPDKAEVGGGTTIFHDCRRRELTLRQTRNTGDADLAPFGLRIDVFRFDGSFLSLSIDLPDAATTGLQLRHMIRLDAVVDREKPLAILARLNIRNGPNVEQIVRELPADRDDPMVEFDLAYTRMNERRVDKMWVDLIFEAPAMNQVTLRDVTFSRRPRAAL